MNKNNKIIAVVVSALLIIVASITFGMKMNENKKSLSNNNSSKNREVEIKDTCPVDSSFPDAIETYYEDSKYICTFNQVKSGCYVVTVDGKEYSLKDALNNKVITIEEAMEKGLHCETKLTGTEENSNSNTNTNSTSNTTSNTNSNTNSNPVSDSNSTSNINTNTNSNTNSNVISNTNTNSSSNKISNSNKISSSNISNTQINRKIRVLNKCGSYTTQQIDEFYQDNEYIYYFTSGISGCTYVSVNGIEYTLRNALNSKIVTMKELEDAGFKCLKKSRNLVDK